MVSPPLRMPSIKVDVCMASDREPDFFSRIVRTSLILPLRLCVLKQEGTASM